MAWGGDKVEVGIGRGWGGEEWSSGGNLGINRKAILVLNHTL